MVETDKVVERYYPVGTGSHLFRCSSQLSNISLVAGEKKLVSRGTSA